MAEQIKSGRCLAGGVTIRLDEDLLIPRLVTRLWNFVSRTGRWLAGSFIFVETAAFRKIGGFSRELFAAEELELSKRLKILARETDREIIVLHRHPIVTSARKMRLYSAGEHFSILVKFMFNRKALTRREDCGLWYDGRR